MLTIDRFAYQDVPPLECWVYALIDPRNNEMRYIGATGNIHLRQSHHHKPRRSAPEAIRGWIEELLKEDVRPRMVLLERVERSQLQSTEDEWITKCRSLGARLVNRHFTKHK